MRKITYLTMIVLYLTACKKESFDSEKQMVQWMNDKKNGLVKVYDTEDIAFTVKYLPEPYLLYRDIQKSKVQNSNQIDSLKKYYKNTMTFILTIDLKETSKGDNALLERAGGYNEYSELLQDLNFSMNDYVTLRYAGKELQPLLWNLENTYTVGNKRNLYLVFAKPQTVKGQEELQLVFNDELFSTGINHFLFNYQDLSKFPKLGFYANQAQLTL